MKQFLSPKEMAACLGVSESTVRRWGDDGAIEMSRTVGGHRRINLSDAIGFIRASGMPVRDPGMLGIAGIDTLPDASHPLDVQARQLQTALENGESKHVCVMLVSMYLAGHSLAELFDEPITTSMHSIGELWEHRDDGIMIEHRATDICIAAINQLRSLLPPATAGAPAALGGALPGDPYLLTSLMAATVVAGQGWRTTNLGPQSPADMLINAARDTGARLVWLSISVSQPTDQLMKCLTTMADQLDKDGISLAVGGRALPQPFKHSKSNLQEVRSMAELAAFANGLRSAQAVKAPDVN